MATYNLNDWEVGRGDPRASWLARLAVSVSSSLVTDSALVNTVKSKQERHVASTVAFDRHTCVHIHKHTHIHTQTKKNASQKRVSKKKKKKRNNA